MDELVGFEAEDLTEVGAVTPGPDQVAYPGEGVAAVLQPADQLEAGEVRGPVDADAATAFWGGEQAHGLVLPDGAHRKAGASGELVDRQLDRGAGRGDPGGGIHGWTVPSNTVTVNTVTNLETEARTRLEDDLLQVLCAATATPTLAFDGPP